MVVMFITVHFLSNAAVEYDIQKDLRKSLRENAKNIALVNGELKVDEDFQYSDSEISYLVVNAKNRTFLGSYPDGLEADAEEFRQVFRVTECVSINGGKYYVRDSWVGESKGAYFVRGIIKKEDADSPYRTMKWLSYLSIVSAVVLILACEMGLSKKISKELEKMCRTAESIGFHRNMSQRMESDSQFLEIAILAQANNRMLDCMEQTFQMQEQFTSDVAHELRTPVAVVMAQCQYAEGKVDSVEEFKEVMDVVYRQSKKINDIITHLLDFSRLDQGGAQISAETLDLVEIAESVCMEWEEKALGKVRFRLNLMEAVSKGDIGLIFIVIQNLVSNAVKFSRPNGLIEVETWKEGKEAYVKVKDNGVGIKEEDLPRVFRRFYKCDKSRNAEGFGLGLALSEKIAIQHGGRLLAESEFGEWSEFTLLLPAAE